MTREINIRTVAFVSAILVAVQWAITTGVSVPADTDGKASAAQGIQDLVFFGPAHPVFIRLRIQVEGRPFGEIWKEHLQGLFNEVDTNRDGFLTPAETKPALAQSPSGRSDQIATILRLTGLWNYDVEPFDGKLTLNELAQFLDSEDRGPFQSPSHDSSITSSARPTRAPANATVGEELFDLLDRDDDGGLSQHDFEQAMTALWKYDFDDDGTLAFREMRALSNPYESRTIGASAVGPVPIFTLSTARSLSEIIKKLDARYARGSLGEALKDSQNKSRGFTASQFGLRLETFEQFDVDSDGQLDYDEVRVFLKNPTPTLELTIRLGGPNDANAVVDFSASDMETRFEIRRSAAGLVSIILGNVQIEVGGATTRDDIAERYFLARFKSLDRDNNNYLEPKEVGDSGNFQAAFDQFDRDEDGKLFRNEMVSVLRSMSRSARSRTRMTMTNRGHDLF